jgi:hypothetical protein
MQASSSSVPVDDGERVAREVVFRPCAGCGAGRGAVAVLSCGVEKADGGMKRRIGDRRTKPRFEIVGDLWASVDVTTSMVVHNVGRSGALLECAQSLAPDSTHWVTAVTNGQPHLVQIRVRHITPVVTLANEPRFLIGVEFLQDFIVRAIADATHGSQQAEA